MRKQICVPAEDIIKINLGTFSNSEAFTRQNIFGNGKSTVNLFYICQSQHNQIKSRFYATYRVYLKIFTFKEKVMREK